MKEILNKGALELAALIKQKIISPLEVVKAHIGQIEKVNKDINAVIINHFDEALKEAKIAEENLYRSTSKGLLYGVPFTVKESISLKSSPITFGSVYREGNIAEKDAPVIRNVRKQGGIVVGVTNTPECNFWVECYNKVYGRTNNPYDISRTPGGSSGGEAAIIGAGGVPFGVGSDVAGSIRMPAAFCGIFGLRPTAHLISIKGHAPFETATGEENDFKKMSNILVIGPMARKSEDLFPLLQIMANREVTEEDILPNSKGVNWRNIDVYVLPSPVIKYASTPDTEIQEAVREAAGIFENAGSTLKTIEDNRLFYQAFNIWQSCLHKATDQSLYDMFSDGHSPSLFKEFFLSIFSKSTITLPGLFMVLGEKLFSLSEKEMMDYINKGQDINVRLNELLGKESILLMPVYPSVAPKHNAPLLHPLDWNYTTLFNALDFPGVASPYGLNRDNLPLSVQIVSGKGNDSLAIEAAKLIEASKGGWIMPGKTTKA